MSLLCAFEACARLQKFSAAAEELHLTQSAVSRQIRSLEEQIGVPLFVRERQTVRLSAAGEAYAQEVRAALRAISNATLGVKASPGSGQLTLAILPTLGTRWLAPQLPGFLEQNPGITLNLVTQLLPFDLDREQVDAAIHYGAAVWPGADLDPLFDETVVPACTPALREQFGFAAPADLRDAPLLHLTSRPEAWSHWLATQGVAADSTPGMTVDQFATLTQAAIAGLGIALLPRFLFQREFARGDLVAAVPVISRSPGRYYLACSRRRLHYPPLQAFRAWLGQVARSVDHDQEAPAAGNATAIANAS